MGKGAINGNSSPVPLYLYYSASPFRRALTTLRTWEVLATCSCPCWSRLRQGICCSPWDRPGYYRQLPEPNLGESSGEPDRRLYWAIKPRIGLEASSRSTPWVSEGGTVTISLTPTVSACVISSPTSSQSPRRFV